MIRDAWPCSVSRVPLPLRSGTQQAEHPDKCSAQHTIGAALHDGRVCPIRDKLSRSTGRPARLPKSWRLWKSIRGPWPPPARLGECVCCCSSLRSPGSPSGWRRRGVLGERNHGDALNEHTQASPGEPRRARPSRLAWSSRESLEDFASLSGQGSTKRSSAPYKPTVRASTP